MGEPLEVNDKAADAPKDKPSEGATPSLQEQFEFAKRQNEPPTEQKRVVTSEHQSSFEVYDPAKVEHSKTYEDGTVHTTYADGVEVTKSDGLKITTRPDGGEINEFSDGTVVIKTKDGIEAEAEADGTKRMYDSEGNSIAVYPDGTTVPPAGESAFKVETQTAPDGSSATIIRGKDGSVAMFSSNGQIDVGKGTGQMLVFEEGTHYNPDGTWSDLKDKVGSPTGSSPGPYRSR